ncbi:MAG: mechanosensitive ion channel [Desulfovibrionaceae bacterium]|nr:mechanosensitive ion channel [Desulfovibrionaceae bacterium]
MRTKTPEPSFSSSTPYKTVLRLAAALLCLMCAGLWLFSAGEAFSAPSSANEGAASAVKGSAKGEEQKPQKESAKRTKEVEEKAQKEAKELARKRATEKAEQDATAVAEKLRKEAEAAKQDAENASEDDALWAEAFRQNQTELDAIKLEIEGLSRQTRNVITPLKLGLPTIEDAARRLFALGSTHRSSPIMQEAVDQRGKVLAATLRGQIQPIQSALSVLEDISNAIKQLKKGLHISDLFDDTKGQKTLSPEKERSRARINALEKKLNAVEEQLKAELAPATPLLDMLDKLHTRIGEILPGLWMDAYFSVPSRFFDPDAWQDIGERWRKTVQNLILRLSIEVPRNVKAWQGVGLRFLNVLILGAVLIFFVNRNMRVAEARGSISSTARRGILHSLWWQFAGLALLGAAFNTKGENFRAILTLGSIFVISGEMTLAWGLRCVPLGRSMGITPLWPVYITSGMGILLCYPNLPEVILSLCWIIVSIASLLVLKQVHTDNLPPVENNLVHVHRIALWISLGIGAIGWARMSILFTVCTDCILISTQFIIGLMQILNRCSEARGTSEKDSDRNVLASLFAAFIAPAVTLMVLGGMAVWIIALPGGLPLLRYYLSTGVKIGSASFNFANVFFILSAFYITRAAISASKTFLSNMSKHTYHLDPTLIPPLQTAITYGLWALFGLFSLKALGFGLENLAVIAGGLSVGIGFGMQNIINNFLSGLIVIFSRTLHEGDIIDVGTLQGVVRKISIRATMVETLDNAVIFVPNSEFISNRLVNWTRNGRLVRRDVAVGVAYGTDSRLVEKLLIEAAQSVNLVIRRPQPFVLFMDFADSTLNFVLRYWTDIANAPLAASAIRHKIVEIFNANNVEIAFPQLDVHLFHPRQNIPQPPEHNEAPAAEPGGAKEKKAPAA